MGVSAMLMLLFIHSCKDEEVSPKVDTWNELTTVNTPNLGFAFKILSEKDQWEVGYNRIMIQGDKDVLSQYHMEMNSQMTMTTDMGTMMHNSPIEQLIFNSGEGVFNGAVVFVMPSTAGNWELKINITKIGTTESELITIPLDVKSPEESRLISFMHEEKSYFVSLVEPRKPAVGINDFEVVVHQKESMSSWPAVNNLDISVEPEMPAMGHGSPNNVDPILIENGHYKGKVNFTMDGNWKIHLTISGESVVMAEGLAFDITFTTSSSQ